MVRLEYHVGTKLIESFVLANKALANWKKKDLASKGYKIGVFKITSI
jgi:hypothetical protein